MSVQHHETSATALKLAGETLLAAALVFGLGWGGMKLAQARHARPIRADARGAIHLRVRDSDWLGNTTFVEVDKYDGAWQCEGQWEVSWLLGVDAPGRYEVAAELAWPAPPAVSETGAHAQPVSPRPSAATRAAPGGRFAVEIGDQHLQGIVPDTSGEGKWKTMFLGQVELNAGSHCLVVRPADPKIGAAVCLKSVALRPAGSAEKAASTATIGRRPR